MKIECTIAMTRILYRYILWHYSNYFLKCGCHFGQKKFVVSALLNLLPSNLFQDQIVILRYFYKGPIDNLFLANFKKLFFAYDYYSAVPYHIGNVYIIPREPKTGQNNNGKY